MSHIIPLKVNTSISLEYYKILAKKWKINKQFSGTKTEIQTQYVEDITNKLKETEVEPSYIRGYFL